MPSRTAQPLSAFRARIDKAILQQFDANPKRLAKWGLSAQDHALAALLQAPMQHSGKRVRAYILDAWYKARGGTEDVTEACILIEAVHTGTLVIDDVQDASLLRRGKPTMHVTHGEPVAISTGLLLLFAATHASKHLSAGDRIQPLVVSYMNDLARGQCKDVAWHRDGELSITLAQYERMCSEKTAKLFILAARMADELVRPLHDRALEAVRNRVGIVEKYFPSTTKTVEHILDNMGIIFQLADDVANLTVDLGKDAAEDLRERKITAVILAAHTSNNASMRRAVQQFFRKRSVSSGDVQTLAKLLVTGGATAAVEKRIAALTRETTILIDESTLEKPIKELLRELLALAAVR